ncbi:ArsR/SmtB family transcription factor [Eubacterium sp.]|uniref:ArsR/SmtB family transcription factor n=1 Tax=Eubacterium sp. TaxID=142586 RepID=UPI002FCB6E76
MASFDRSVKILKALGHPIRFQIVQFLLDKPHCVCELKEHLDFSQPNLSQHLKILKEAGIIDSEKVGIQTHYHICLPHTQALLEAAEAMGDERLENMLS